MRHLWSKTLEGTVRRTDKQADRQACLCGQNRSYAFGADSNRHFLGEWWIGNLLRKLHMSGNFV